MPCCIFSLIGECLGINMFSGKVISCFLPGLTCRWSHVTSFKIKTWNIFSITLIIKRYIFLINAVCSTSLVFRGEWVGHEKKVNMMFCVAMSIWTPPFNMLKFFFRFHSAASDLHMVNSIHTLNSTSQKKQRQVLKYPYFQDGESHNVLIMTKPLKTYRNYSVLIRPKVWQILKDLTRIAA